MRALITGSAGFAGSHLCDYLAEYTDWEIFALCYRGCSTEHLDPLRWRIALLSGDLLDKEWVDRTLREVRPGMVFHLAALSSPAASFGDPAGTLTNNILAQLNLLQAIQQAELLPRTLIVGSGDEYGLVRPDEIPVREDTPLRPTSPYAVSKVAQDYMALQYYLSYGLPIVRVRPFNHIGPRQTPGFVTTDFARQIAQIEAGLLPPVVRVGNLSARRDFTDVRDMVRAYYLAATLGEPGQVYNIGSGEAHSIEEILHLLIAFCRLPVEVETDPQKLRPVDIPIIACDSTRFRQQTGWTPRFSLLRSLEDILAYWRSLVQGTAPTEQGRSA